MFLHKVAAVVIRRVFCWRNGTCTVFSHGVFDNARKLRSLELSSNDFALNPIILPIIYTACPNG